MSDRCRSFCPNVLECTAITDQLAAEHNSLEIERTQLEQINPSTEITDIASDYGQRADALTATDLADFVRRYDHSAAQVPGHADLHRYVFDRLAALHHQLTRTEQQQDAAVAPARKLDEAVAECKGPTLTFTGKVMLHAHELQGHGPASELGQAYYLSRWAKCRSQAARTALQHMPVL